MSTITLTIIYNIANLNHLEPD